MTSATLMSKPDYQYEFGPDEIDAITTCNARHGFAIVRGVISSALADEMKSDIMATIGAEPPTPTETRVDVAFVERAPSLMKLLENQRYVRLYQHLVGSDDLVLHRSAAIIRQPGSPPVAWHTDTTLRPPSPQCVDDVLNSGEWPAGMWFYLTGSIPEQGGLAVIEGSHLVDWQPPAGFVLSPNRKFIHRVGESAVHGEMDVPGAVQMVTAPEDLIVFAARTYHAANAHRGAAPRLSAGAGFRPRHPRLDVPWALPDSSRRFIDAVPAHLRRFVDGYTGIVQDWRPEVQVN